MLLLYHAKSYFWGGPGAPALTMLTVMPHQISISLHTRPGDPKSIPPPPPTDYQAIFRGVTGAPILAMLHGCCTKFWSACMVLFMGDPTPNSV